MTVLAILVLILVLLLASIPLALALPFFFGAPYLPTPRHVIKEMLELARVGKEDIVIDLGSGDGAVLIEAALLGAMAKGWEINPFLVLLTKVRAQIKGLNGKIFVYAMPYQKANFKDATVIFCYNMPKFMPGIEKKLRKEAPKNVKIISYKFPIPNLNLIKKTPSGIFLYSLKK